MKKVVSLFLTLNFLISLLIYQQISYSQVPDVLAVQKEYSYWLLLHRKSNEEFLYHGVPGKAKESELIKTFRVKSGIPGKRPTPLPELLSREYWIIKEEQETPDSLETAPYFLELDIPYSEAFPYGPAPYMECSGQCDWVLPGSFGLHGVAGDWEKLSDAGSGSSGCVRHSDEDITYLYNLLDPRKEEIRYYIEDI